MNLLIRKKLFAVLTLITATILGGCSATPENNAVSEIRPQSAMEVSHKIAIVNASDNIINTIKYKPCGSNSSSYQYLTGNLRPAEKFTINIYSQCVDLLATNAFKRRNII